MVAGLPLALERRFDALVFDWDGTAVPDRHADASRVRALVEKLCASGMHVVVVSGTHVGNVDPQLGARPDGPGRLFYALNRGSELFEADGNGVRLIDRREATAEEDAALTRAAEKIVSRLAAHGLEAKIVSQRLNRRKIDLIPVPEWADPPKAVIDRLLEAVEARLAEVGIKGIPEIAGLALDVAREEGLRDPKVTSDAKHVEVGLTDKSDSTTTVLRVLWQEGVAPSLVCFGGDEFGSLGGMPGSDSLMLTPATRHSVAMSVGVEPTGVPPGVLHVPGGPPRFIEFLEDQLARRGAAPEVATDAGWSLVVDGFDPTTERAQSALLTIADGVIGTTGAPLLQHRAAQLDVVAAGVYDGEGPLTDLLGAPRWSMLRGALQPSDRLRRSLDLHTGTLGETVDGATTLRSARFVSRARPGLAVLRADIDPPEDSEPIAPDDDHTIGHHNGRDWMSTRGTGGSVTATGAQTRDGQRLERFVAYVASPDGAQPEAAVAMLDEATAAGFERVYAEHRRAWARRWERADIVIDGDAHLQRAVRLALFHLMSSVADEGEAAVGARGLSGHAYKGHVFWDADLFVLPFLAATHPESARAMLEYRLRRLPAAEARARAEGREGARFPWESATTGEEVTPIAGRDQSGHVVPIRTGESEVHIIADIAWAACCYGDWSGDEAFRKGPGLDLLVDTARYWASRVRIDRDGHGHLYGVIGPDEYHEPVDDSAYTNVMARWNLRRAAADVERLDPERVPAGERANWRAIADGIVDGYRDDTRLYEEFAGFFDLEPLRIADVAPRRPITADLLLGRDRVRGAQVVKQADVVMMYHLVPDELVPGTIDANLDFYEPRTAHGSSLSPAIHAAVMARAGRVDDALAALQLAAYIDLEDLTATGAGGLHLASMGGVWQALAFGFMGVAARDDALSVAPRLPDAWNALELRVVYRGVPVALRATRHDLTVRTQGPMVLAFAGVQHQCDPGTTTLRARTGGDA